MMTNESETPTKPIPLPSLPVLPEKDPMWLGDLKIVSGDHSITCLANPTDAGNNNEPLKPGTKIIVYPQATWGGWIGVEILPGLQWRWVLKSHLQTEAVKGAPPSIHWQAAFNEIELKIINGALGFAADPYPDPGSHLKIIVSKFVKLMGERP